MVGTLRIELHIPAAHSLKEKRSIVRPFLETSRVKYRVAIAEVGFQDFHQRAVIEVAAVASSHRVVVEVLDAVERLAWSTPGAEVVESRRSWLEDD